MGKGFLQGLRLLFGMMLFFGVFFHFSGQPRGPITSAYDYTLMGVGGVGSLVMWAFGLGKPTLPLRGIPGKCPDCGAAAPLLRKPANRRQFWWGGWTCPQCGCEVDRTGKKVPDPPQK